MNVELSPVATESLAPLPPPDAKRLRGAELCQILHWLASGRVSAQALTQTYLDVIAAQNAKLNAYVALNPRALDEARAGDVRRASGKIGRLDGVPVAVDTSFFASVHKPDFSDVDFSKASLFKLLIGAGLDLARGETIIEAHAADPALAQHLGIDVGKPTLVMQQIIVDASGKKLLSSKVQYVGDRYRLRTSFSRSRKTSGR